jgi:hypothetical protein
MFYHERIVFYRPLPLIHNGRMFKMERLVLENPTNDEYDHLVLLLSLIIIIALGSLPLLLLSNGLIWTLLIWVGAISVMTLGFRSSNARKLIFVYLEDSGIGLQFKNGRHRKIEWKQVKEVRALEQVSGKWLLIALIFPFAYTDGYSDKEKQGLMSLRDGSRYRVSWEIAEAVHAGHYESTGKWLT